MIGGGIDADELHETGINRVATFIAAGPYTDRQIRLVAPSGMQTTMSPRLVIWVLQYFKRD